MTDITPPDEQAKAIREVVDWYGQPKRQDAVRRPEAARHPYRDVNARRGHSRATAGHVMRGPR